MQLVKLDSISHSNWNGCKCIFIPMFYAEEKIFFCLNTAKGNWQTSLFVTRNYYIFG